MCHEISFDTGLGANGKFNTSLLDPTLKFIPGPKSKKHYQDIIILPTPALARDSVPGCLDWRPDNPIQ